MATPRQRRKARSSTQQGSSARAKRHQAKKVKKPAAEVRGPEILKEKWDRTKTVRQNYAALGLVSSVKINPAGGLDPRDPYHRSGSPSSSGDDGEQESSKEDGKADTRSKGKGKENSARKGMARIIRDEDGNVVDIIEAEEDEEEGEPEHVQSAPIAGSKGTRKRKTGKDATPWGAPLNESSDEDDGSAGRRKKLTAEEKLARDRALMLPTLAPTSQGAANAGSNKVHAELEQLESELSKPVPRFTSHQEEGWLKDMVQKYGEDFDGASRDRNLNVWQKTSGEIKRAVRKAGGVQALLRP